MYTVSNTYGISGESKHRSVERALRERDRREGTGWVVHDADGNQWDDYIGRPHIVEYNRDND